LKNPFLFLLILLLAGGTYVAYTLNLLGPMMHMGNAALTQGLDIGKERLREYIMNSESARQAMGVPANGGDNIRMETLNKEGKAANNATTEDDEI
jgi:protein SEY1